MAFIEDETIYRLVWEEGHPLAGLEVRARPIPLGTFLEFGPQFLAAREAGGNLTAEQLQGVMQPFTVLADALVSWNYQVRDAATGAVRDVPCTLDGLFQLGPERMQMVLKAWMEAGVTTGDPLGPPSPNGKPVDSRSTEEFLASLPN